MEKQFERYFWNFENLTDGEISNMEPDEFFYNIKNYWDKNIKNAINEEQRREKFSKLLRIFNSWAAYRVDRTKNGYKYGYTIKTQNGKCDPETDFSIPDKEFADVADDYMYRTSLDNNSSLFAKQIIREIKSERYNCKPKTLSRLANWATSSKPQGVTGIYTPSVGGRKTRRQKKSKRSGKSKRRRNRKTRK